MLQTLNKSVPPGIDKRVSDIATLLGSNRGADEETEGQYKAKRYALKFDPACIFLEYEEENGKRRVRAVSASERQSATVLPAAMQAGFHVPDKPCCCLAGQAQQHKPRCGRRQTHEKSKPSHFTAPCCYCSLHDIGFVCMDESHAGH